VRVRRYRIDESYILNPGLMRQQITWQGQVVSGQNPNGEDVLTWGNVLTCKADITGLIGLELERAQQKWAEARYRIIQHYYKGLTDKMRVAWLIDGTMRYLDVLDISDPPGTGRYQVVTTRDFQ
jgi:SPP1 family predicted phage head-tail adaptor